MGKHSVTSGRIWRTIVVSGAMLATPLAACGGGADKHEQTTPLPATEDKAAADKAAADKAAADTATADQAATDKKAADDKAAADQAAADQASADQAAADQKAADDAAAKKKRPRGGGDRPTGRGFVLA
jgi:membrane protein involved in colicin uptake